MLLYALDLLGIAVFAVSGALAAGRKSMDLLGVLVLALVTSVGGGTIRDVLLGHQPVFWLVDPTYLIVIIGSALLTVVYVRLHRVPGPALLVLDALGLALFSVAGARIAEAEHLPAATCVLLGTVTGCAGGVVRDILSAEVPLVLRRGNLYASAAIAGTTAYVSLVAVGVAHRPASFVGIALVSLMRLAAIWWGLQLPIFRVDDTVTGR